MDDTGAGPVAVLERLLTATKDHDLDAMVSCFADDYFNETPAHPKRGFRGKEQVRANWTQIFAGVPDIRAEVLRSAVMGDTVWTEWEMSGTRRDGVAHLMRGVMIFEIPDEFIASMRFYMEPVEETSGDIDAAIDGTVDARAMS